MELQESQETSSFSQHENKEDKKEQRVFLHEIDNAPKPYATSAPLIIALLAVAVVVIEIIFSWIMVGSTKAKITNAESRINDANRQLSDAKTKLSETEKYATGLNNAFSVYNQEIINSKDVAALWDEFKIIMVPNTRLKSVGIDEKGKIKIEGEAKSYVDVANLIASFNKKSQRMSNINLINLVSGEKVKSFNLSASYNPPKDTVNSKTNSNNDSGGGQ